MRGLVLILAVFSALPVAGGEGEQRVTDGALGASFVLPAPSWSVTPVDEPASVVRICTSARWPGHAVIFARVPGGQEIPLAFLHAEQAESRTGEPVRIDRSRLPAGEAERLAFSEGRARVVELWFRRERGAFLVKVVSPGEGGERPEWGKIVARILGSLRLDPPAEAARVLEASPERIRALREAIRPAPLPFAVRRHELHLSVEPVGRRLSGRDRITVVALRPGVRELRFRLDHGEVEIVSAEKKALAFHRLPGNLAVELGKPLGEGEHLTIEVVFRWDAFLVRPRTDLLPEVRIDGQVTPESSYSSGIAFYPVDARNDASARIEIAVPDGYVACSGGEPAPVEQAHGMRVYGFEFLRRPRPMPFGFAVAKYRTLSGSTPSGLGVELAYSSGGRERAKDLMGRILDSAGFLEDLFGRLPWRRIAVALVHPVEGIEGVSLPGLVLASGEDPGPAIDDELSHQWHFHAAELPNELSEGLSVLTDLLLVEHARGAKAARRELRRRLRHYLSTARTRGDAAVADPRIYGMSSYSAIAFQKVAAALWELRAELGDPTFRRALRHSLSAARPAGDAWAGFRRGLEQGAGRDLSSWFTDRFFRPGVPVLLIRGNVLDGKRPGLELTIAQCGRGPPMTAVLEVGIRLPGAGWVRRRVVVSGRAERKRIPMPVAPAEFRIDPDATGLFQRMLPVLSP